MQKTQFLHTSYCFVETHRQTIGWFVHEDRVEWQVAICHVDDQFVKATGRDLVTNKLVGSPFVITLAEIQAEYVLRMKGCELIHPDVVESTVPQDLRIFANGFIRDLVNKKAFDLFTRRKTFKTWR